MIGNFLLWLSYILHTIGIENIFEKYFRWIVALKYLLELFHVFNCGQSELGILSGTNSGIEIHVRYYWIRFINIISRWWQEQLAFIKLLVKLCCFLLIFHTRSAASILYFSLCCSAGTSTSSTPSAVTLLNDFCWCYSAVRLLLLLTSAPLVDLLFTFGHFDQSLMTMPPRCLQQNSIISCYHCSCSYFWVPRRLLFFVH